MNLTRVTLATASSVLVLATLAACGSDDSGGTGGTGGGSAAGSAPDQQVRGGQMMPGAQGKVAAVTGSTAQVQSQMSGQVAVTWNGRTTFTQEVDATRADVTVGSCVVVTSDDAGSDASDASEPPTEVTAASVRITATNDDGSCGFGGGRPGGGQRPDGAPSGMPEGGMPEGGTPNGGEMPSGAPSDGGRRMVGFGTIGEVTAVSDSGFTVTATTPSAGDDSDADTTEVQVTVGSGTTYTKTAKAAAPAVKTGVCVSARGEADDTGAVAATSIAVSQAVDGECTGGFGMGGPGGRSGSAS